MDVSFPPSMSEERSMRKSFGSTETKKEGLLLLLLLLKWLGPACGFCVDRPTRSWEVLAIDEECADDGRECVLTAGLHEAFFARGERALVVTRAELVGASDDSQGDG